MLRRDAQAASPVIGVILLVAITVALGGAVFVMVGVIDPDTQPPRTVHVGAEDHQEPLTAGTGDELLAIDHRGGDGCVETRHVSVTLSSGSTTYPVLLDGGASWCVGDTLILSEDGTGVPAGNHRLLIIHTADQIVLYDQIVTID